MAHPRKKQKSNRRARRVLEKPPLLGWRTSDEDELNLRRWRGRAEIAAIEALEPQYGPFGTFRVRSNSGSAYEVEIRDLAGRNNSCGCIDHRVSGLGTCKHIEGVLAALRTMSGARGVKAAASAEAPRVEIFLGRAETAAPAIRYPKSGPDAKARVFLAPFCGPGRYVKIDPANIKVLVAAVPTAPKSIRISRHFDAWLERELRLAARERSRAQFLAAVAAGRASWDRQAAAAAISAGGRGASRFSRARAAGRRNGSRQDRAGDRRLRIAGAAEGHRTGARGLPDLVKAEWEDQIARFSERGVRYVAGLRPERLRLYSEPAFFTLVNYEQVVRDVNEINHLLRPDVVILDEAQRIKNWPTKTARKVKSLKSPFAFVLTGTPLENRIDETYSIVQYLDPEIFGPLFRFNRDFYELDHRGRPVGYRNLERCTAAFAASCCAGASATWRRNCPAARSRASLSRWRMSRPRATPTTSIWPAGSPPSPSAAR